MNYERPQIEALNSGLNLKKPLMQVITGPRQVGKTTAAEQWAKDLGWPLIFESADSAFPHLPAWIENHWERARRLAVNKRALLVLDEVQKVQGWSETVKRLWDEDRRKSINVSLLLLGSSALLMQKGLGESLAGRFLLHRFTHWSWKECHDAFGWTLDQWLYFGGYPGSASLVKNEKLWKRYINDSLIETVLARDIFQLQTVTKPALLRQLFAIASAYPAQIFSYNKMLGQLNDAGNTTTLAHYLELIETAFLASGLEAFSKGKPRKRGSSPKLMLWNNALINGPSTKTFAQARNDGGWWGRLVENAVGATFLNTLHGPGWKLTYWREGELEVDYVISHGDQTWAVEVKSGRPGKLSGLLRFREACPKAKVWLIGSNGIPLEEFFETFSEEWFS